MNNQDARKELEAYFENLYLQYRYFGEQVFKTFIKGTNSNIQDRINKVVKSTAQYPVLVLAVSDELHLWDNVGDNYIWRLPATIFALENVVSGSNNETDSAQDQAYLHIRNIASQMIRKRSVTPLSFFSFENARSASLEGLSSSNLKGRSFPFYYNVAGDLVLDTAYFSNTPILADLYALQFDGVNDYIINQNTTPFQQFERTQPFTFFINLDIGDVNGIHQIFDTRISVGTDPAIIFQISNGELCFFLRHSLTNQIKKITNIGTGKQTIQITWDGNDVEYYINGTLVTSTYASNNLTDTIINGDDKIVVGARFVNGNLNQGFEGKIRWLSITDYVKGGGEIMNDAQNGFQSQGLGNYLLDPIDLNLENQLTLTFKSKNEVLDLQIVGQTAPPNFVPF